jgi:hypothetical protein
VKVNRPPSSVVLWRVSPLLVLVTTTVAPWMMAPDESLTSPRIDP